ncbi:uncharacterized [Tachysurus ichikawai]
MISASDSVLLPRCPRTEGVLDARTSVWRRMVELSQRACESASRDRAAQAQKACWTLSRDRVKFVLLSA